MEKSTRRYTTKQHHRAQPVDVQLLREESFHRGRVARKVRSYLRQLRPVALVAPRWSAPATFLEEIAAQLSPALRCRTASARSVLGRSEAEAWNFVLHALNTMVFSGNHLRPLPMVMDRRGFCSAVEWVLQEASQEDEPTALLLQNAENLPLAVLEDLGRVWMAQETQNHCTLLVAASVATPALTLTEGPWIELEDYTAQETLNRLYAIAGTLPADVMLEAVQFSGGVPAIVDTMATSLAAGIWPTRAQGWWATLGILEDDLRAAVQVALASPDLAERFFVLRDGRIRAEEPRDRTLLLSGLIRRVRSPGVARVQMRAPAFASLAEAALE